MPPGTTTASPPDFVRPALEALGPEDTLAYFRRLGLLCRAGGQRPGVPAVRPQANSVLDTLRLSLEAFGVTVRTECQVTASPPSPPAFS